MIRPRLTLLLPLAAVLIAGCSTFTDNDAVARFDDVELSADQMVDLMAALSPQNTKSDPTNAGASREMIATWLQIEAVKQSLARQEVTVGDELRDEATTQMANFIPDFAELPDTVRDYLVGAQAAFLAFETIPPPAEAELRALYAGGPTASGITCVAHILVDTEAEADAVAAELADGADFAALAADRSLDPGSAAQGGSLPCTATDEFTTTFVPPFVEATLVAEIGVPTAPVESAFGYHVIRVRPFDEAQADIDSFIVPQEFALSRTFAEADIHVDPRYGTYDDRRVIPLS